MDDETGVDRAALRRELTRRWPWLGWDELGPRTVPAGECDRCASEPRLVGTCGPVAWEALGRRCAAEVGLDAWCDGHADDGERYLAWLGQLPPEADEVTRLWWVATGEVRLDPAAFAGRPDALGDATRAALTGPP